jgi:hypothetical protein
MKELKDKLMSELKEYGHGELTRNTLEIIDTLAHALKNVMKIELMCNESEDYEKSGSEVVDELEKVLEKIKSM